MNEIRELTEIQTSSVIFRKCDDGILETIFLEGATVDLAGVKENQEAIRRLFGDAPVYQLVDARQHLVLVPEAHSYYGKKALNKRKAIAYVTDKVAMRLLFNVLTKVYKFRMPVKMFEDLEKGREWLHQQQALNKF